MKIILASQSPRRRELLSFMGVPFEVIVRGVDEDFPSQLDPIGAVRHIAEKKAMVFRTEVTDELVIAADTIVTVDGQILGKPKNRNEAVDMLTRLSGTKHDVITAVSLLHQGVLHTFHEVTGVYFRRLIEDEIDYYIAPYRPVYKGGGLWIKAWIGVCVGEPHTRAT